MGYAYDLDGNLTTLTYPGGSQVTRSYDHASRVIGITDWLHNTTNFAYDANGNTTLQTYPNSTTAGRTFNAADQLTQIVDSRSGVPFLTFSYGRDSLGQLSSANDPLDTLQHNYGYDALNRLTKDARTAGTTSWGYDKADQLTNITDPTSGTSTLSYDVAHELTGLAVALNGVTTKNLTMMYNSSGDRTGQSDSISRSSIGFRYDQANRLTSYTAGTTSATYAYNGDGLRLSKTVGGTTGHEVWDLAEGLPVMLSDGTNSYVAGADGLPLEQVTGSSVTYLYQDQLGSTRALLDGSGTLVGTYTYGPFGDVRSHTGTATTPFGYAGQYTDGESGLQYLRARYYDPSSEQFLTVDPVVAATGQPYSYASGDPTNAIDPFGLCTVGSISVPIGSAHRCSDDVGAAVYNHLPVHRLPDYVNFDLSGAYPVVGIFGPGVGFNATITRYGQVYYGPELGAGVAGVSGSLRAGWINQGSTPSPCQLDSYVQGPSLTASAFLPLYPAPGVSGVGPSVGETWGNEGGGNLNDFSTEVGVGAGGGHDFGLYQSYSFKAPFSAPGW